MRFKQFNQLNYLLEGIKVIHKDDNIRKISSELYTFTIDGYKYEFISEPIDIGDIVIYNTYFTSDGQINRQNKFKDSSAIRVFNKVITCMVYFINDIEPEMFTFTSKDPKLLKLYNLIIVKIMKQKPFDQYKHKKNSTGWTFIKNNAGYLTSEMLNTELLGKL